MSDLGDLFSHKSPDDMPDFVRLSMSSQQYGFLIGAREIGDIVLPVRIVHNGQSGRLVVRCVGMMANGRGCAGEWELPPHGEDVTLAHAISGMLGHVQTEHNL